ncbi:hypothetical protein [Oceanobacillus jeddahense]|uniref:hypothetical protein n=1 Tax=Oceanobacillus jeddahense TaxID=1462527 RepID=UPI000A66617B|nr:hypothetical protein [Oceanobacillus jeddahense]
MSNDKNERNKKDDNLIKKTSKEVNDLFGHTVDTSGKIIKSISGEGGLVGKATDASGKILKGTAGKANDIIGKTSEVPGKLYKSTTDHGNKKDKNKKNYNDEQDR